MRMAPKSCSRESNCLQSMGATCDDVTHKKFDVATSVFVIQQNTVLKNYLLVCFVDVEFRVIAIYYLLIVPFICSLEDPFHQRKN
jgi:hypothetical protein